MAYNRKQVLRDNIEAIRLALRLGDLRRGAQSVDEIAVLRKYAGFGGLKCILNDVDNAASWSRQDLPLRPQVLELRQIIHDFSRNDREFAQYMDSLKTSVLTAFYTPTPVVDAISGSLKQAGIEVRSLLEPSAGQGAFIDSFLRNDRYPYAEVLAYEKDLLTGKILSALHPSILTRIEGFEKIERDFDGYFDIAASNIPFGDFAVADPAYAVSKEIAYRQSTKAIHNYFFLKALDQVREGGLVAFIASQGVMNAASPFVRMEMVKRADLVAALRLPNNTFSDNAGTDAGSDLIILQKHTGKKMLSADEEFFIQSIVDRGTKVPGNKYLMAFPQNVISTTAKIGTDPYGKPAIIYKHEGGVDGIASDLRTALDDSLRLRLNLELYNSNGIKPPTPDPVTPTPTPTPKQDVKEKTPKVEKQSSLTNTPLMQQYQEMKKKHPDAILLFRVGDFYEIFGKDAVKASEILGITLTRRANGRDKYIELAGFPHHALDNYLPKLVRAGHRVAICEQLEDPKLTNHQSKHDVTELITPSNAPKHKEEDRPRGELNSKSNNKQDNLNNDDMPRKKELNQDPVMHEVDVNGVFNSLNTKGEAKLSDHYVDKREETISMETKDEKAKKGTQKEEREPQMVTVNGEKVTHGHAFKSTINPEDWYFTAKIDGVQLKPQKMDSADLTAYSKKEMTVPQLMEKYYPTKLQLKVKPEEFRSAMDLPSGQHIDKFNVYKEKDPQRPDFGKYKFFAKVDGKNMSVVADRMDLNAYFDRTTTPARLVEKNFGEKLHLASHYEQFHLPEGMTARVYKGNDDKWKVTVDMGERGRLDAKTISFDDGYSYFKAKTATREQLAAKYHGAEIASRMNVTLNQDNSKSLKR